MRHQSGNTYIHWSDVKLTKVKPRYKRRVQVRGYTYVRTVTHVTRYTSTFARVFAVVKIASLRVNEYKRVNVVAWSEKVSREEGARLGGRKVSIIKTQEKIRGKKRTGWRTKVKLMHPRMNRLKTSLTNVISGEKKNEDTETRSTPIAHLLYLNRFYGTCATTN